MKNVFEINVQTEEVSGENFTVKKLSPELQRKLDEMTETFNNIRKNASIPLWLNIIMYIAAFVAVCCTSGFFDAAADIGFAQSYANARWVVYAGGAGILTAAAIFIYKFIKLKKTERNPAVQYKIDESKKLEVQCYEDLKVPEGADNIDIFASAIKIKKGGVKPATSLCNYVNTDCKIFKDGENLYIADLRSVYAFPLNGFTKLEAINKRVTFNTWNKEEKFNKGIYKQYKVRASNNGTFSVKPYHSLQFLAFNEEYEIVIPGYELQTLSKYVNLNVTYGNK